MYGFFAKRRTMPKILTSLAIILLLTVPSLEAQGLDVTRDEVALMLLTADVSPEWEVSSFAGERREVGARYNPFVMVELMGPESDLREINMFLDRGAIITTLASVTALRTVFPDWMEGSARWFLDTLESEEAERSIQRRGIEVILQNRDSERGVLIITAERR